MIFGVLPEGFKRPTFQEIYEEIVQEAQNLYGPINLEPESAIGQELTIRAEREALLWEALEAVYLSQYPSSASGLSLDEAVSLVGVSRLPATRSVVDVEFTGDAFTSIPDGSQASTNAGGVFELVGEVVLDSSGEGQGQMRALESGAVLALSGTLVNIETPISGWDTITNPLDAQVGRPIESDPELRERQNISLTLGGSGTVDSIRARLIQQVDDVNSVAIIENRTSTVDGDGRPPHSYEVIVEGGVDQDIGDQLWLLKPAGIETFGDVDVTVEDSQGEDQLVSFSRPVQIFIWMKVNLIGSDIPAGIEDDVKTLLVDFGVSNFGVGDAVIRQRFFTPLYMEFPQTQSIELSLASKTSPTPAPPSGDYEESNIEIGNRETSQWLDNRIEVTLND